MRFEQFDVLGTSLPDGEKLQLRINPDNPTTCQFRTSARSGADWSGNEDLERVLGRFSNANATLQVYWRTGRPEEILANLRPAGLLILIPAVVTAAAVAGLPALAPA